MTDSTPSISGPLEATLEAFDHTRGVEQDSQWAWGLCWALLTRDVESTVATEALREALALVQETQESPEELYGPPAARADELCREWLDEGPSVRTYEPVVAWREVPSYGLATTGGTAIVWAGLLLAKGQTATTWAPGILVLSFTVGMGATAAMATWETLIRRRNEATAVAVTALLVVMVSGLGATALFLAKEHSLGTIGTWWLLVPAAACFAIARLLHRRLDDTPTRQHAPPANDDEWAARLAAVLRVSVRLSESRVRTIVAEARAHAAESGVSLAEEFGTPEDYAARWPRDRARQSRLQAGLLAVFAAMAIVFLLDEWSWNSAVLAVVMTWLALSEVRQSRRHRAE